MLRELISLIVSLSVGGFTVALLENVSHTCYGNERLRLALKSDDDAAIRAAIAKLPTPAFVLVVLSWGLATFFSAITVHVLTPTWSWGPTICAVAFTVCSVGSLVSIPSPTWMWPAGIGIHIPAFYAATIVGPHVHAHGVELSSHF